VSEKHVFLSDGWFEAVGKVMEEHAGSTPAPAIETKVNMVVTDTPFERDVEFHMGSEGGKALMGTGHVEGADVTMTTDYATAADVFVSGNPAAGMQAFMAGKVRVQGDMGKLMASQSGGGGANPAVQTAIQELTEVPSASEG
jgi:hypothetical protein